MRSRLIPPMASWSPFYIGMTILAGALLVCTVALDLGVLPHETGLGSDFSAFYAAGLTIGRGTIRTIGPDLDRPKPTSARSSIPSCR